MEKMVQSRGMQFIMLEVVSKFQKHFSNNKRHKTFMNPYCKPRYLFLIRMSSTLPYMYPWLSKCLNRHKNQMALELN